MVLESIDQFFILVNPRREPERLQRLFPHLLARGLPQEKITLSGPTWGDELTSEQIFKQYDPFCRKGMPIFTFKARCLSRGEISLVMNFIWGVHEAIKHNYTTVCFLESDVFLREDFTSRLDTLLKDVETSHPSWEYISLGEGVRTRPPNCDPSQFGPPRVYTPPHQFVYRCTDSMVFRVSYLRKIIQTMYPFRECLDWELNIQSMHHKSVSLWADPPLVEQGTTCGRLQTTLTS